MSANAEAILQKIRALPPMEQREVGDEVLRLRQAHQRAALKRLRGASTGKRLLQKLLADRAKERARE